MRTIHRSLLAALLVCAGLPQLALGHGGGLDSSGGHYNRKTGEYHYHRPPREAPPARAPAPSVKTPEREKPAPALEDPAAVTTTSIRRVLDGDTVKLKTGVTVRLVGVDCPELKDKDRRTAGMGRKARDYARRLCQGKKVMVHPVAPYRDRYGRLLAYIYLADASGRFVNEDIVRSGYGLSYRKYPHPKLDAFNLAEAEAKAAKAGLWAIGFPYKEAP